MREFERIGLSETNVLQYCGDHALDPVGGLFIGVQQHVGHELVLVDLVQFSALHPDDAGTVCIQSVPTAQAGPSFHRNRP